MKKKNKKIIIIFCSIIFLILILIFFLLQRYQDPVKSKQEIIGGLDELDNYISEKIDNFDIDKLSIAIVSEDELIYSKDYGMEVGEQLQAGSISKVVSSYCALSLVEEGNLSLDEPMTNYLKEDYFSNSEYGDEITLRMVLSHTSGLKNDASGEDRNISFEPGTKFSYSGGGFAYLQKVMEKITGRDYADYMDNKILRKLGMNNSTFVLGYNGEKRVRAASSLVTTTSDLSKFFIELLNPKHLNKELIEEMMTPQVHVFNYISWGLGIGLYEGNYEDAIWHWGNNRNLYHTLAIFYTDSKTGVIIMVEGEDGDKVYKDIAHKAIGGDNSLFSFSFPVQIFKSGLLS